MHAKRLTSFPALIKPARLDNAVFSNRPQRDRCRLLLNALPLVNGFSYFKRNTSTSFVPPETSLRFPTKRDEKFGRVTDNDLKEFERIVGRENVITSPEECLPYNIDWLRLYRGQSRVVLRPRKTSQVSDLLRICNQKRFAVVPQGGNTSLVGGSVPVFDEIIINMNLMNRVLDYDPISGILQAQAGVILENLEKAANEQGRLVPIDLGAKGSCHIGGNVMTCAGGIRLFRYGSLHANVLGLEMVLADGSILPMRSAQLKDNTGYHMHHLFLGSEGTLGICTAVAIRCPILPACRQLLFLALPSFESVLQAFQLAESTLTELLSAFEYLDSTCMQLVVENLKLSSPFGNADNAAEQHKFYAVIEVSGSDEQSVQTRLDAFLERAMSQSIVVDGIAAASYEQQRLLWQFRERIIEALQLNGHTYKFDLSVPKQRMHDLVEMLQNKFPVSDGEVINVAGYGHLGDNNMHLGVSTPEYNDEFYDKLMHTVFDWVAEQRGSISAEHGIGIKLAPYVSSVRDKTYADLSRSLKDTFDPKGILNPYKMFPPTTKAPIEFAQDSV